MLTSMKSRAIAGMLLAAYALLPASELRAQSPVTDSTPGCIIHDGNLLKFVIAARSGEARAPGLPVCVIGDVGQMQARFYAALARKYPNRYQSLQTTSTVSLPSSNRFAPIVGRPGSPYHATVYTYDLFPPSILFFEAANGMTVDGRQFGTAWEVLPDGVTIFQHVGVLDHGRVTLLREGYAKVVNRLGTAAGSVVLDFEAFIEQAAIFRGNAVEMIPRLPDEVTSSVIAINDLGDAIVQSRDASFASRFAIYRNGKLKALDVNYNPDRVSHIRINNTGLMSLTKLDYVQPGYARAFRLDLRTMKETVLPPQPTEHESWAQGINDQGDVLGYSFINGSTERVGIWHPAGGFVTHFLEGTTAFPTISNFLHFNATGLILISGVQDPPEEVGNVYVVPRPGQRLNLADQVRDMPSDAGRLGRITGVNVKGDIGGVTWLSYFNENLIYQLQLAGPGR